jgi:hypothetical protein
MPKKCRWKVKRNQPPRQFDHVTAEDDDLAATWAGKGYCEIVPDDTPLGPWKPKAAAKPVAKPEPPAAKDTKPKPAASTLTTKAIEAPEKVVIKPRETTKKG